MNETEKSFSALGNSDASKGAFETLTSEERLKRCVDLLPDLLGKWEDTHQHWRLEVLLWLLDRALKSLRHYIESGQESEISWESPFVELHFPVGCTWESDNTENSVFRLTSGQLNTKEMSCQESASKALAELVVQHLELVALQDYTNGVAFEQRGEKLVSFLDPKIVEHVREHFSEDRQQKEIERLYWPKSFGASTIDLGDIKEGEYIGEEVAAKLEAIEEPLLAMPFEVDGNKLRVITIFEINPLVANADTKSAYFPIVVGLAIQWDKATDEVPENSLNLESVDFPNWPEDDRTKLWAIFHELVELELADLGPKPEPEMVEAVISVNAQIKVTVPRGNEGNINHAMSEMLKQFSANGEVLSFKIWEDPSLLALPQQNGHLQLLLSNLDEAKTADEKGKTLECLVSALFDSVHGFKVLERIRTETEEIDLWISNESECRSLRDERDVMIAECKNWSGKCGKNEFGSLYLKILNRGGRCSLGFLISWNGFSNTITAEMLRASREAPLIVPIDGTLIRAAVQSGDFLKMLLEARQRALMV